MKASPKVFLVAAIIMASRLATVCFADDGLSLTPQERQIPSPPSSAIKPIDDLTLSLAPSAGEAVRVMTPQLNPASASEAAALQLLPPRGAASRFDRVLYADVAPSGESTDSSDAELAKKLNNPVADLISVPFQYNADFGIGPKNASRSTLNIQPVIPVSISKDWNVIIRTILPVIYADSPANGISTNWGLGDTTQSFFFSPKEPIGGWVLAIGPAFLWPSATDTALGTGQWAAGPTALALRQESGWTYGVLANHLWSYAGDGDRPDVNATFLQPFLVYTFPTHTSIGLNSESTYDWTSEQWTVPINLFVTQILRVGKQPLSVQLGGRYYAEGPSGGPEWGLRFAITFLFPK